MPSTLYIVGVHNTLVYGEVISDGGKQIIHKTINAEYWLHGIKYPHYHMHCIGVKVKIYCLNLGKIKLRLNFQKSN